MRALAFMLLFVAGPALATTLTPASPQPDPAALKPGLRVEYVYPPEVKSLREARSWNAGKRRGRDLSGLNYPNTRRGENALTSDQQTRVVAHIRGYIRFDKAGAHQVDFMTNDGLEIHIGGQRVGRFDGRQPCTNTGAETVTVPQPGWYELKALWFQRLNTSCLQMMLRQPGGALGQAPDAIFAYSE